MSSDTISNVPTNGKFAALRKTSTTVRNIIAVRAIPAMKFTAPQRNLSKANPFLINPPIRI
jgi:hypothetical protein